MLIDQANITKLIPQRPPILMIDALLEQDDVSTSTSFEVRSDDMFIRDGKLLPEGMLENIAQTAAARAGYYYHQQNATPPLGFIGAITKVEINGQPKIGDVLKTTVSVKSEVFNITLIIGKIERNGEILAQCEMKIVLAESE